MSLVAEQELMWALSVDREVIQEFCQRNQIPEEKGPIGLCYDLGLFSEAFKKAKVLIGRRDQHYLCSLPILQDRAQKQIKEAIREGTIIPEPCEICGHTGSPDTTTTILDRFISGGCAIATI